MGGITVQIPLGAVALYQVYNERDGLNRLPQFENRENQLNLEKFHHMVKEACIRSAMRFILENKIDALHLPLSEQVQLQTYEFDVYLRSCKFIEFDTCPKQLLKDKKLDQKKFPALDLETCVKHFDWFPIVVLDRYLRGPEEFDARDQGNFVEALKRHINELKELESIDELYAYRKSLAKCEFIKSESDFDEIFYRLKHEENWTKVADDVLKTALRQHFSLLALKRNTKTTNGIIPPNKPIELSSSDLQEAVDCEHRAVLSKCVQKHLARRLECYHQQMDFKQFFTQGVIGFDASGIEHVLKSVTPPGKRRTPITLPAKLSELLYKSKKLPKRKYAVRLLSGVGDSGIIREGLPLPHLRLNHVFGKSTKGWPALMAAGAGLVTTGLGISRRKEKLVQ